MLRIRDSLVLVGTKFRIRRIRLTLSLLIISLICAAVCTAILATQESVKSLTENSKNGISDRMMASAMLVNTTNYGAANDPKLIARAEQIWKNKVAEERAIAKKLGIEYEPNDSENPILKYDNEKSLNFYGTEIGAQVWLDYLKESGEEIRDFNYLKTKLADFKPKFYRQKISLMGRINLIIRGKEFRKDSEISGSERELRQQLEAGLNLTSSEITKPFRLKDAKLNDNEIPILVSYEQANDLLGLKSLTKNSTDKQRYERIQEIRHKINDVKIEVCWRNESSTNEVAKYENTKANQEFSPIKYAELGNCANPQIIKDQRSAEEKLVEQNQQKLLAALGKLPAPAEAKLLTYRVVGISGSEMYKNNILSDWQSFLSQMANSSITSSSGVIVDQELFEQSVKDQAIKNIFINQEPETALKSLSHQENIVVEFSKIEDFRWALKKYSCTESSCPSDIIINPYGNNLLLAEEAVKYLLGFLNFTLIIVVILTAILIYVVVNRIMSDARKETAVFRAIGYSQFEISQIYMTYIFVYSLIVAILTAIFVLIAEVVIRAIYEPNISQFFTYFFASDQPIHFVIMRFSPTVVLIFVPIFIVGFIASALPLIINTRRSPLKNLRSE